MCGFIAMYQTRTDFRIEPEKIRLGLEQLHHRGPDERNLWMDSQGRAALGHARLSIIGLSNGLQPIGSADNQVQIVVNGEFYDYERIRAELIQLGYQFKTQSDSEIALHLYCEYGVKGLHRLRGEFALVLYDSRQNTMLLMRDRMGIKPLFYSVQAGAIYVASEIKAIVAAGVPAQWDENAYASRSFYLRDGSLFKGINSVLPGHMLMLSSSGVRQTCYWDLDYTPAEELNSAPFDEASCIQQVHDAVNEAVSLRLRSDVPMAFYLSGGVDSSAMLGIASHISGHQYNAFNLSFSDMNDYDENRFARLAAQKNNAFFHTIDVTQTHLADNFERALWHNETPFFNAHGVAKYLLSASVRASGFKAVITGEGADEVFAGYPHFRRDMVLYNSQNQDPDLIRDLKTRIDSSEAGYSQQVPSDVLWLLKQLGHGVSWIDNQAGWFDTLRSLYNSTTRAQFGAVEPFKQFYDSLNHRQLERMDPVHRSMYLWVKSYLPNFVLTTLGDRMEMANSIEGRVPLLDHKVVELAARLPVALKVKGNTEKYIFREAMKEYLPTELYQRKKHYFRAPPATLMRQGKLFQLVMDTLHSNLLENIPFFEARKVRELLQNLPKLDRLQQALIDPMLMELTSLCLLQKAYGFSQNSQPPILQDMAA